MNTIANPMEKEIYDNFKRAYEAHERRVWELEVIVDKMSIDKHNNGTMDPGKDRRREKAVNMVKLELDNIQHILMDVKNRLNGTKSFMESALSAGSIEPIMRKMLHSEILKKPSSDYLYTLQTAILDVFLESEKLSRASIYKKRFRGGFKTTAADLIDQEKLKNEATRKEMLSKYNNFISKDGIKLIERAYMRRIARHGEEAI